MARLKCPRTPRRIIPTFTTEQIERLPATLDPGTPTGLRDYAIVLIFLDTLVRLSELVNLRLEGIDFCQSCLLVKGKGNKESTVCFGSQVRRVLWRDFTTVGPELASPQVSQFFLSRQGEILRPNLVSHPTKLGGECSATPYGRYTWFTTVLERGSLNPEA